MRYTIRPGLVSILIVGFVAASFAQLRAIKRVPLPPRPTTPTASAKGGIHIPPGRSVSLPWTTTDSQGYRWDIAGNGTVSDGTNDAYDGGLRLQVNSTTFPSQPTVRLRADGKEIETGWRYNNLNISRRVFVNAKAGYCRWIDIFENTTGAEVTLSLRYYSNMGEVSGRVRTTSGGNKITAADWGVVTGGISTTSPRPAIVHIFATPKAKLKPAFQFARSSDSLYYNVTIKVPAGKPVALCFFEAQRRPYDQAVRFLAEFDPARELRLVPNPLRRILLNMSDAGFFSLGGIKLTRDEKNDLLILRNKNEIRGRITNKDYTLQTDFGEVKFAAGKVIALVGRPNGSNRVHLVMTDGQIIAGELKSGPLRVELAGGTPLKIPPKSLLQAAYHISPEKPEGILIADSLAVFRSGARLAFDEAGATFEFTTPHGALNLSAGDLRSIEMDTPAGGLHRAVFRNGSTLAGLLSAERIRLKLKLGSTALTAGGSQTDISRRQLKRFVFTTAPTKSKDLAKLTFRNKDVILGRFADKKWTVRGKFGAVTVKPCRIATVAFSASALGQVKLTLRDGTALNGKLVDNYIKFQIEPGPTLKIFVGHVKSITGAARPKTPTNETPEPATPTTRVSRIPSAGERANAKREAREKAKKAEIEQLNLCLEKIQKERVLLEKLFENRRAVIARNANDPQMQAKLQKILKEHTQMLVSMKIQEEKLAKRIAEVEASLGKRGHSTFSPR